MRFQVPQFIEFENKIFGPLSFRQFIYLAGGAGIIFIVYIIFPFFITVMLAVPIGAFAVALSFYKVNNRSFAAVTESAIKYFRSPKIYIWKKEKFAMPSTIDKLTKHEMHIKIDPDLVPKLNKSKLKELSWSLDIKHNVK